MSMTGADRIEMNLVQQQRLRFLIWAGTTAQELARRARTVLLAAQGWTSKKIAQPGCGVRGHRSQVTPPLVEPGRLWRRCGDQPRARPAYDRVLDDSGVVVRPVLAVSVHVFRPAVTRSSGQVADAFT
jgi:hypothetical protein